MLSSQDWSDQEILGTDMVDTVDNQYDSPGYDDYYDDAEYDDYDDGYDDESYDDDYDNDYAGDYYYQRQLDRVLDELSELKKSIKSNNTVANQPNQVHFAPDHISWPPVVQPARPSAYNHYSLYGNSMVPNEPPVDNALKGELYQLREQLNKIREDIGAEKHEQRLQAEIAKLKDDFSKERTADQRANENRREMLSEMAKLNGNTELEKMKSTFELEKIRSAAELEKIKANAELEKIKLSAELERTKADTEMMRLGNGLDLNNKLNMDNSFKKEIDKLSGQLDNLRGDNGNSMYGAEIARLNAQILALQNAAIANSYGATIAPKVQHHEHGYVPTAVLPASVANSSNDLKDEIARLTAQINRMSDKQEQERYLSSEFEKVNKGFGDIQNRNNTKDIRSYQAQFNNTILQELRHLSEKVEALPKNELSPQEDSNDYLDGGEVYNFSTNLEGVVSQNIDNDSVQLPLGYIQSLAKKAKRNNINNPVLTVKVPEQPAITPQIDTEVIKAEVRAELEKAKLEAQEELEKAQAKQESAQFLDNLVKQLDDINKRLDSSPVDEELKAKVKAELEEAQSQERAKLENIQAIDNITHTVGKIHEQLVDFKVVEDRVSQLLQKQEIAGNNYAKLMGDVSFMRERLQELSTIGQASSSSTVSLNQDDKQYLTQLGQELTVVRQAIADLAKIPQVLSANQGNSSAAEFKQDIELLSKDIASIRRQLELIIGGNTESLKPDYGDYLSSDMLVTELGRLSTRMDNELSNVSNQLLSFSNVLQSDVQYIRQQIESNSGDNGANENVDITEQLSELVQEIKSARLVDQADIAQELEGLRSDISEAMLAGSEGEFGDIVLKSSIEQLLNKVEELSQQVQDIKENLKTSDSTSEVTLHSVNNLESERILSELNSLKYDVRALNNQVSTIADINDNDRLGDGLLVGELTSLRNAIEQHANSSSVGVLNEIASLKEAIEKSSLDISQVVTGQYELISEQLDASIDMFDQQLTDLNTTVVSDLTEVFAKYETTIDNANSSDISQKLESIQENIQQSGEQAKQSAVTISQELSSLQSLVEQVALDTNINSSVYGGNIKQEFDSLKQLLQKEQEANSHNMTDLLSLQNSITNTIQGNFNNLSKQNETNHHMLQQSHVGIMSALDSLASQLATVEDIKDNSLLLSIQQEIVALKNNHLLLEQSHNNHILDAIERLHNQLNLYVNGTKDYENSLKFDMGEDDNKNHQFLSIKDNLASINRELAQINSDGGISSALDVIMLQNEIIELRTQFDISNEKLEQKQSTILESIKNIGNNVGSADNSNLVNTVVDGVRQELSTLRQDFNQVLASNNETEDAIDGLLLEELVSLKSTIKDMSVPTATLDTQALNDILSAIKQEVGQLSQNSTDSQAIEELKVDIQELVQRLNTNTADQNAQGLADIKKQLNQLKDITNKIVANNEFVNDFAEQFELLQKELREVKKIKEEPDYSALNEIMQVRNEFDAIKTQLSKLADNAIDNSQIQDDNQNIVKELQAIKRDIFNVSMANVGDNGVDEFENYNQILFDEITRLSEQIQEIKTVDQNRSIDEILQEISDVKRTISENNQQLFANDSELDSKLDRLRDELVQLLNDKE